MKAKTIIYSIAVIAAMGIGLKSYETASSSVAQMQLENVEALTQGSDSFTVHLPCEAAKSSCTVNFQDLSGRQGTITESDSKKSAPYS